MQKSISGKVFVLGDNIDTDQIISAHHLVYNMEKPEERKLYGRFALAGVPDAESGLPQGNIPFTDPEKYESEFTIIVAGKNFGCGSSREHAPFALQVAGCQAVISPMYARIFYRNAVDGGFLIPFESRTDLTEFFQTGDEAFINTETSKLVNNRTKQEFDLLPLGEVAEIVDAGGIFEYARKHDMIPQ